MEGPAEVTEGDVVWFTLRLSEPSGRPTSVWVQTTSDSALSRSDFVPQSQRVQFRQELWWPGLSVLRVAVPTVDDSVGEPPESFWFRLHSPSRLTLSTTADAGVEVVILDDDGSGGGG